MECPEIMLVTIQGSRHVEQRVEGLIQGLGMGFKGACALTCFWQVSCVERLHTTYRV